MGYGTLSAMPGRTTSRDLGEHGHAYVTRNTPPFIVATTRHGFLVLDSDDPAQTRRLFEALQRKMDIRR